MIEQFYDTTTTTSLGGWACQRCGLFVWGWHDCSPPVVASNEFTLGRIADALERIAKALERDELR